MSLVHWGMRSFAFASMCCAVLLLALTPRVLGEGLRAGWAAHIQHAGTVDDPIADVAARFLSAHAPARDAGLDAGLLNENLELALRARREFAWAGAVPEEVFLNDVLPYASLDETRERWRPALYAMSRQIVKDATTASEAAQLLNQRLFKTVGVHYNTGRKQPNQSAFESMKQGRATCTGLSILLVNACRSVGIPARIAGVAKWTETPGNHTWVEIWDNGRWHYTGADEYDANGLDRGWFTGRAASAIAGSEDYAVWASSWQATGAHFPMAWNRADRSVPGVDVSARYVPAAVERPLASDRVTRFFRVWDRAGGERVVAAVSVRDADGSRLATITTRAGRADLNDMPSLEFAAGATVGVDIRTDGAAARTALAIGDEATGVIDLHLDGLSLSRTEAGAASAEMVAARRAELREARSGEIGGDAITIGDHTLRLLRRDFGAADNGPRPLWISMHGGGGAPTAVNDQQWQNQIRLYEPADGIYIAPRAPTDTWNLWHQSHIDPLFDRLIENLVVAGEVDPDRVYLLGYSAGGDGVYQVAPRMADRFAAAAMMAGHPNESQPLGLRNLPFAIYMGGDDSAFNRNGVAQQWGEKLAKLREGDSEGYVHRVTIYPGVGHWMERRDAEALPWMLKHTREAWPRRVVWHQDDVVGTRFYWLSVRPDEAGRGQTVAASVNGQEIAIDADPESSPAHLTLRLHDELLDLDEPVRITVNGASVFEGRVLRTRQAIETGLSERFDPSSVATALIEIALR